MATAVAKIPWGQNLALLDKLHERRHARQCVKHGWAQIFKDPYLFDMLGTADPRREAEVEQALVAHVEKFLLELGAGFVGRKVPLEVGESDFKVDLLFYRTSRGHLLHTQRLRRWAPSRPERHVIGCPTITRYASS